MAKQSKSIGELKMDEKAKRGFFGKKYFIGSVGWFLICMITFIIVATQQDK